MSESGADGKDSVTEVAEESFVRERPPEVERGTVLAGRYQIEDIIGKGGSGIVLRVFDRVAQNVVALKVLRSEHARDAKWEKRFSRELRLGRPIQHPNVCRIFDIGEADGHRFLTMELARGGSLRDELKRTRSLGRPIDERLADAKAVIAGLAALHAAGVVHRDFKPDNLLRMEDGRLVLSDFGLATDAANAPGATVLIGTPHYMAPEVLAGEPATSRSDVWALGVVLHEICFGQRPERRSVSFDGSGKGPLRPTSTEERAMLALCERCMAEGPLDRPSDARFVEQMFGTARPSRVRRWSRRRAGTVAFGLAGLATVSIAGLVARHRTASTTTSPARRTPELVKIDPAGAGADWSKDSKVVAEIPGHVHCFSVLDGRTARLIWGSPRKAEDVDISSGRRRSAQLAPETYLVGCPQLSPDGKQLLFVGHTQSGAPEIRLSESPDGRGATAVTSGEEPLWLGPEDAFAYNVDGAHVAIWSLTTMRSTLLPEPAFGDHRVIIEKTVSRRGDAIALLLGSDRSEYGVAVYDGQAFERQKVFATPFAHRIQFGLSSEVILASAQRSKSLSTLVGLGWRSGQGSSLGHYPDFDIVRAAVWPGGKGSDGDGLLLARHVSSDVWSYDGKGRHRLTSDGNNYSAALSAQGDLLLSKWGDDGNVNIWLRGKDDAFAKEVTHGNRDVGPSFSEDGRSWAYADYAQKSIMVCSTASQQCRVLHRDELLPYWPRFSPNGEFLAYLTEVGASKLVVVSTRDGQVRASWDAYYECPPIWSSPTTLWSFQVASGHYAWFERDAMSGTKTGNRFEVPNDQVTVGEVQCWPRSAPVDSRFFQRERVETMEVSRILKIDLPSSALTPH